MSREIKGTLIVLEGGDGSGKQTQVNMLVERLRREGCAVETMDFPHGKNIAGSVLKRCLNGERTFDCMEFIELPPKIASVPYAVDRAESSRTIRNWLDQGSIVILDRFASANMLHQSCKLRRKDLRMGFVRWLQGLEYYEHKLEPDLRAQARRYFESMINSKEEKEIFYHFLKKLEKGTHALPRPDTTLYLHVPAKVRAAKLSTKEGKDSAEGNLAHQLSADAAMHTCADIDGWAIVECTEDDEWLSETTIHDRIWNAVQPLLPQK